MSEGVNPADSSLLGVESCDRFGALVSRVMASLASDGAAGGMRDRKDGRSARRASASQRSRPKAPLRFWRRLTRLGFRQADEFAHQVRLLAGTHR